MQTQYQIIFIGARNNLEDRILEVFFRHLVELGVAKDCVEIIKPPNFSSHYKANAPTYCLYFGSEDGLFQDVDIIQKLQKDATLILPVVSDLSRFTEIVPSELLGTNGFELANQDDIESLVSSILEGLSLLRLSRRLFISYKRDESSSVAIQLFEALERSGFDVFLDTHSIRPGEPFQDELWHRLADTDVVVLLNTPGFLKSNWTTQELAQANAMSIGILQLIWPTHTLERDAELSIAYQLKDSDFGNDHYTSAKSFLNEEVIRHITSQGESLRARSLASRQDNIITEFISAANKLNVPVDLQPENSLH